MDWYGLRENREGHALEGRALKWEADQAMGFFGYTAPTGKDTQAQPRFTNARVDIAQVMADRRVRRMLSFWRTARRFPNHPPFSGGGGRWPAAETDVLPAATNETAAIDAYVRFVREKKGGGRG